LWERARVERRDGPKAFPEFTMGGILAGR